MRKFRGPLAIVITTLAIAMSLFHLYTGGYQAMAAQWQRGIHLGFGLVLIFLLFPLVKRYSENKIIFGLDVILAGLSFYVSYYYLSTIEEMLSRQGNPNTMDIVMATLAIILILEATRRTIGWVMAVIALFFLSYGVYGAYFPEIISHAGIDWNWLSTFLYLSTEGIYGIPIGVSATFVFLFVLFTTAIQESGGDKVIVDIAAITLGGTRGGSAKASVFMGVLIGMISGSPVAAAAAVGSLTIPLMINKGFRAEFAAVVTAIAANGGALMPPVMGAAAFIMAEFLNVSYLSICVAAILPALLYYFSIYMAADFEAAKQGIGGIPKEERPIFWPVMKSSIIFTGPFIALLLCLGVFATTPQRAAAVAFVTLVAIYFIQQIKNMSLKRAGEYFVKILKAGTLGMLTIIATCATAGLIVGVVNLSGLGMQLSSILVDLSGGSLLLMLILTMITSIVLGMGLPVTACYIILAVLAAPALIQHGISPVGAHLFVFYFGIVSGLTPPVALTAYVAAGIAKTPVFRTGFYCFLLAGITYLIPFVFVYSPSLMFDGPLYMTAITFVICALSIVAISAGVMGYLLRPCNWVERVILIVASVAIIIPELYSTLAGLVLFGIIVVLQYMQRAKAKKLEIATS
ncbi:MAG: Sialic acid TRAP transporter permease protein SiaT [Smithella sp. PtaU1.Bin162]|nr:MAG: Sialic acid TRAP transporter permease protein SiaT [Smithella sp. PtaU1.Bin162]